MSTTSASSSRHSLTAVVAATTNNGIGKDGGLPWRLPSEMKYFARVTTERPSSSANPNAVIMGRKTWESIPPKFRPLKDRQNLVISRQGIDLGGAVLSSSHSSLDSALSSLEPDQRAFLIGGAQFYNLSLDASPPLVDRVLLTRVMSDVECDTFLSDFTTRQDSNGKPLWTQASHEELEKWVGFEVQKGEVEEKGFKYRFEMWTLA